MGESTRIEVSFQGVLKKELLREERLLKSNFFQSLGAMTKNSVSAMREKRESEEKEDEKS